ncbi:MAG: hypothetical protein ACYDDZ_02525 [Acidimicrobiales bacterium]
MREPRFLTGWLLLGLVVVFGVGGAVLGVFQAPSGVPLRQAVASTLKASGYTEVVTESTPQGAQTDHLVYQAPDRLGGYVESGARRTYVYVIGPFEYQSRSVPSGAVPAHLTFFRQAGQGAKALDPARGYLSYAALGRNIQQSGSTYSFSIRRSGQTGHFTFTVSGRYVSEVLLGVSSSSVRLVISDVGTSPAVALPPGSRVVSS